jgi:hypothetical protein
MKIKCSGCGKEAKKGKLVPGGVVYFIETETSAFFCSRCLKNKQVAELMLAALLTLDSDTNEI